MRHLLLLGWVLCLLWPSHGLAAKPPCENPEEAEAASEVVVVELDTDVGTLRLGLLPGVAPDTVANFLGYAGSGAYDGIFVHRAAPGFVVQTGGYQYQAGAYTHIPTTGTVENEFCLSNVRGTVAMAKLGGDPDSATSEWFVNLADNTFLDLEANGSFTVFARVLDQENNPILAPGTSLGVPDEIDAGPRTDGCMSLEVDNRRAFEDLPLVSELEEDPAGYGCFSTEEGGLLLTTDLQFLETDSWGCVVYVSRTCTDSGQNAVPDPWPCTPGVGRSVVEYDLATQTQTPVLHGITCDELAQSEDSSASRRADLAPQIPSRLVKINSATVVPEPAARLLGLASIATLALLHRHRARNPTRAPSRVVR